MGGWHDARLGSGGSATLSVTGKSLYGVVMEQHALPGSRVAGQYCSHLKDLTELGQFDLWVCLIHRRQV
jgi:hypothetical protein